MLQMMQRAVRRWRGGSSGIGGNSFGQIRAMEALEERRLLSASLVDFEIDHMLHGVGTIGSAGDQYGWTVAEKDGLLLIGAPRADVVVFDPFLEENVILSAAGRAFLVDPASGQTVVELAPSEPAEQGIFGQSVAFVGDRLLVGAIGLGDGDGKGTVFVYDMSGELEATIANPSPGDWFGNALASYGDDKVLIHTQFADNGISDVHLFSVSGSGWDLEHTFTNEGTGINNSFGRVMAASGDRVVIGAPSADGAVVVYQLDGVWTEQQVITGAMDGDVAGFRMLGSAIVFDGDDLLIGAPGHTPGHMPDFEDFLSGAVHRFQLEEGLYVRTQSYPNPEPSDSALFGNGLAISGDRLLVGSRPAAYLLDLSTGEAVGKLSNPEEFDPADLDSLFGSQVAIAGNRLVVGDASVVVDGIGAVYISEPVAADEEPPVDDEPGAVLIGGTLTVRGAVGGSHIQVVQGNDVEVIIDGVSFGSFTVTEWIVVRGGTGDNVIELDGSIAVPAALFGGPGNDKIKGGGGPTIIVGGGGNDSILGGIGHRSLLIGGNGADRIIGRPGDDILISGSTIYDDDLGALQAILSIWSGPEEHAVRVGLIREEWFSQGTITHDGSRNILTGSSGDNWFIFHSDHDKVTDLKDQEFDDLRQWAGLDAEE